MFSNLDRCCSVPGEGHQSSTPPPPAVLGWGDTMNSQQLVLLTVPSPTSHTLTPNMHSFKLSALGQLSVELL